MSRALAYAGNPPVSDIEKDVIQRWRDGDRAAFETIVRRHMSDAYLIALGLTGNPEDARDLSQDAFVKAHRARKRFDPERPFLPWFYRILKNHCLNFVQRKRKSYESLYHGDGSEQERFASGEVTPLEILERRERVRLLRIAIAQLSEEHREVIVLKNFKGYSYKEMAELLQVPIGTVMSRLYYARKMLKDLILDMEQNGVAETTPGFSEGDAAAGEVV